MSSSIDPSVSRDLAGPQPIQTTSADRAQEQRHLEQGSFNVQAQGVLHGIHGNLSVDWVEGDPITLAGLTQAYSPAMTAALARELGISAASDKPLTSYQVAQARDILEAAGPALEGVRFADLLRPGQA